VKVVEEHDFVVRSTKAEPIYKIKRPQISDKDYQRYVRRQIQLAKDMAAGQIAALHKRFDITYQ
jgi:hypothetical protein